MMKIFKKIKKVQKFKKNQRKIFLPKNFRIFFFPKILQKIILDQKHSSVDQKCGNFETIDFFLQEGLENFIFRISKNFGYN